LGKGSRVFIADNVYVQGIGGMIEKRDRDPNTYRMRSLKGGGVFTIVKNSFSVKRLVNIFGRHMKGFGESNEIYGKCFWYVDYVTDI
jgi:hypothetical protein